MIDGILYSAFNCNLSLKPTFGHARTACQKHAISPIQPQARLIIELTRLTMRLLRRSKSSGDIPAPIPAFPTNVVRKLASRRKSNALALSSASIALSIGSPLSNTRGTSIDGTASRGRDSGWRTAYAAARIAVETAKESSDMFPPLKAVLGAMSVLIQNCDVSVLCL
jgi:hypothetical protein